MYFPEFFIVYVKLFVPLSTLSDSVMYPFIYLLVIDYTVLTYKVLFLVFTFSDLITSNFLVTNVRLWFLNFDSLTKISLFPVIILRLELVKYQMMLYSTF